MCELLGMSSNVPATLNLSLSKLAEHGGFSGPHRDGWGVAYYEGPDVRLLKEADAAADSEWNRVVRGHNLRSHIVMADVRRATMGNGPIAIRSRSRASLPGACTYLRITAGLPAFSLRRGSGPPGSTPSARPIRSRRFACFSIGCRSCGCGQTRSRLSTSGLPPCPHSRKSCGALDRRISCMQMRTRCSRMATDESRRGPREPTPRAGPPRAALPSGQERFRGERAIRRDHRPGHCACGERAVERRALAAFRRGRSDRHTRGRDRRATDSRRRPNLRQFPGDRSIRGEEQIGLVQALQFDCP